MSERLASAALLALTLFAPASAVGEAKGIEFGLPNLREVDERTVDGRKIVRFEHDSVAEWGYAAPQRDYLYLVSPKVQWKLKKIPLCVVMHTAGQSGETAAEHVFEHPEWAYSAGDQPYYILIMDCKQHEATDWWWGNDFIQKSPELYRNEPGPTEKRVLSSIEAIVRAYHIDRNRIYLSGISMGGSGSLGIGMCRGDVFAAMSVTVPAGVDHVLLRMKNLPHADPPPIMDISSQTDPWSKGHEQFLDLCKENKYALRFAWGPFGHAAEVTIADGLGFNFPYLDIRKNEAYPVFTNASTDQKYPGHLNTADPDQQGQINAWFRWKNVKDSQKHFAMELRLVKGAEFPKADKPIYISSQSKADVTLRRLQKFQVAAGGKYHWKLVRDEKVLQGGEAVAGADGLLTIPALEIDDAPALLTIE